MSNGLDAVERLISQAFLDEEQTGRLANALRDRAAAQGYSPDRDAVGGAVSFVREYVEHVPGYLREGLEAARMVGREPEMRLMVDRALEYWLAPVDIIPDELGLLGVIDDAYFSLTLMQSVSDRYEEETGRPLFSRNLRAANDSIRNVIGEPAASQIDMHVGGHLKADAMTQMVRALTAISSERGAFPIPDRAGWGDQSTEDVVRARLGRLGLA